MNKILAVLCVLSFTACSSGGGSNKNPEVLTSSAVPAAQGEVRTQQDTNGNTQASVNVKHLAQPNKLYPGASAYVVWILPRGQQNYQNIGALRVNNNLEGSYETKVPYDSFNLIITPERSTTAQAPEGMTVIEKSVSL